MTALFLLAAPFAASMAGANVDDNATWGLCQADEANEQGDEASNGTVDETPPFANTSEEDCEEAEHPADRSVPGPDDRPGADENPGDEYREDPGGDDGSDAGEEQPEDPPEEGSDQGDEGSDSGEDGSGNRP